MRPDLHIVERVQVLVPRRKAVEMVSCVQRGKHSWNRQAIREYGDPILENAGFHRLQGSLFNSAIMKNV